MPHTFVPQSKQWKGTRAVLFVHGVGNASAAGNNAFPLAEFTATMGAAGADIAVYTLNYDFINDWASTKTQFTAGIESLKNALKVKFGGDALAGTVADYGGDVLWPVLSADIRFAVRDAFIAQLIQIHADCGDAAFSRGDDWQDYTISIIAHSLGCFHTYEVLWAIASDPQYLLQPRTNAFRIQAAVLMASPVQLIRSVGGSIAGLVQDKSNLATLVDPLALPSQTVGARTTTVARKFVSITGSQDPVGGHLLGNLQPWGYMALGGQTSIIDPQTLVGIDQRAALEAALNGGGVAGAAGAGLVVDNPHSWTGYVARNAATLQAVLA